MRDNRDLFHKVVGMIRSDKYGTLNELTNAIIETVQAARQAPASGEVEPLGYLMTHPRKPPMAVTASSSHPEAREADAILGWSYTPLYAHPPAKVPKGWKLVPLQITAGQLSAAWHNHALNIEDADTIYQSFLVNAPQAPSTPTPATTPQLAQQGSVPEWVHDGYAVYSRLSDKAKQRTSADNVSDTLDAIKKMLTEPPTQEQ